MNLEDGLPPGVAGIAEYLAGWAKPYDNRLKWNEKAKFKADLMNARQRWGLVRPEDFAAKLRKEGMRGEDIAELIEWLKEGARRPPPGPAAELSRSHVRSDRRAGSSAARCQSRLDVSGRHALSPERSTSSTIAECGTRRSNRSIRVISIPPLRHRVK